MDFQVKKEKSIKTHFFKQIHKCIRKTTTTQNKTKIENVSLENFKSLLKYTFQINNMTVWHLSDSANIFFSKTLEYGFIGQLIKCLKENKFVADFALKTFWFACLCIKRLVDYVLSHIINICFICFHMSIFV